MKINRSLYLIYFFLFLNLIFIGCEASSNAQESLRALGTVPKQLPEQRYVQYPPVNYKSGQIICGMNLEAPRVKFPICAFDEILSLGIDHVSVIPYAYLDSETGKVTFDHPRQWWGESTHGVIETIKMANAKNLAVMLKPHVWVGGQGWAGDLKLQGDALEQWKKAYERYIIHYAKVASKLPVSIYCIGTELRHMVKEEAYWQSLISKVRRIFSGQLTYASNWDNYEAVPFWNKLDYIGIDAYFPLVAKKQAITHENLKIGIDKINLKLEKFSQAKKRKVLFTEFGFKSQTETVKGHWNAQKNSINEEEQALAFDLTMRALDKEKWFAGGFIWKWHLNKKQNNYLDPFSPQNKIAADTIRYRFQDWKSIR